MSVAAGTRLGPYEIHSLIGAGGTRAVAALSHPTVVAILDVAIGLPAMFERAVQLSPQTVYLASKLGQSLAIGAFRDCAEEILRSLDARAAAGHYVSPFWRAALMLALGQLDEGYAQLERWYREGAPTMRFLGTGWLDVLRGQPRFVDLARRIGLPTSVALQRS